MNEFSRLRKNLKRSFSGLKVIKIAVLGDTATQFLTQALRATGYDRGLDLQIWEADFNQIERQVFDPGSELYAFCPEVIVIFHSSNKLLQKYNKLSPNLYASLADDRLDLIDKLRTEISARLESKIIYYNYLEIDDAVYGSYACSLESSFLFQIRKLNYHLMMYASKHPEFQLCDLSSIQNRFGRKTCFQASVYTHADIVLSLDILPEIAGKTADVVQAMYGILKKCLIIDLDNTLWGGVIGDDGLENIDIGNLGIGKAFTEFQYWLKKLKNRGLLLAVCSKNTEAVAASVFTDHPEMVLGLDDFVLFIANWENKVENIRQIQATLNIGFDSMVFLDDSKFERNMVREYLPAVEVPELPEDPADYLDYLYSLNLFEVSSVSEEDGNRTKLYQTAAQRADSEKEFHNADDFLKSLGMHSSVTSFNSFNSPRVAQLAQRSNQFNLRANKYAEADIERISASDDLFGLAFTLEDKFGDNGLIAATVLRRDGETLFIDAWFMSCRVLQRGMEHFVLNKLVTYAIKENVRFLKGEYIPTKKNRLVEHHYLNLGFKKEGQYWVLDVEAAAPLKTHIHDTVG